ncbi:MAG: Na/Pi cotransporter family protein, partial [Halioglobus sp.]|nr:Na/Pi cotransporter family protein [Halioglobus sp.]
MLSAMSFLSTPFLVLVGLALFLFGMERLEAGVRALGYDTFKRWIALSTASPVRSAGLGIFITALLQSSSLVSLLVLAFASAGVLPLYNAVGVILGANLGTTITGWIVAAIGFKLSLSQLALPVMAAGAVLQMLPAGRRWLGGIGQAVFGLGLILLGLDIMKDAVAALPGQWDMGALSAFGPWLYFLVGALIAAVVQSSSATMMLTLAALNSGLIELQAAAAVVIGADLGTTSTTALGSVTGHVIKRRLALGNFLFNVAVDTAALLLLLPVLPALLDLLRLTDPLYSLVAFHSIFNLLGLLVFLPFLRPYADWLERRFSSVAETGALSGEAVLVPEAGLAAAAALLEEMRTDTVALALYQFHLRPEQLSLPAESAARLVERYDQRMRVPDRYAALKAREEELLRFSL